MKFPGKVFRITPPPSSPASKPPGGTIDPGTAGWDEGFPVAAGPSPDNIPIFGSRFCDMNRTRLISFLIAAVFLLVPDAWGRRVLYLGDSLSMGAFGRTLDSEMRAAGHEVYTYVTGGATPYYWLSVYAPISSTIGHWEKTPESDRKYKYIKAVPKLEGLLDLHDPEIVVVQTGVNLYSTLRSKRRSHEENVREVTTLLENMCRTITKGGRACYWISPPASHPERFPSELQQEMLTLMKRVVEKYGVVFDSGSVTRFADPYPETDGIHYGPTEAREWAAKVAVDFVAWSGKLDLPKRRRPLLFASREPMNQPTIAMVRTAPPRPMPAPAPTPAAMPTSKRPTAAMFRRAPANASPAAASPAPPPAPSAPTAAPIVAVPPPPADSEEEIPFAVPVEARIPIPSPPSEDDGLIAEGELPKAVPVAPQKPAVASPSPAPDVYVIRKALPDETPSEVVEVDIILRRKSVVPHLSDVPYEKAFAIYEWEVVGVDAGRYPHSVIRIAHPVVWGGRMTSAANFEIGKRWSLELALLSRYPSLEQLQMFDDLDLQPNLPIYIAKL